MKEKTFQRNEKKNASSQSTHNIYVTDIVILP